MAHSQDLIDSLDSLSEDSELTLEERIDNLGQNVIANALYLTMKSSKGQKTTEKENEEQAEMMKRFKEIANVYSILKKNNRVGYAGNSSFDADLLRKIKARKSSIGNIVIANTNEVGK